MCGTLREFICIIRPNGCEVRVEIGEKGDGVVETLSIEGAACKKGSAYVERGLKDPQCSIVTSVLVKGEILPLASVRLISPIPKCRIFDAAVEIRKRTLTAPVEAGIVVTHTLLGYDMDVTVTEEIPVSAEK